MLLTKTNKQLHALCPVLDNALYVFDIMNIKFHHRTIQLYFPHVLDLGHSSNQL
jgi:hypothetical protein